MHQLQKEVAAAQEEFDLAIAFHETWKPMAYDTDLHARMGNSYATQSFLVIRSALRREMVLAVYRLWDSNKDAIKMTRIAEALKQSDTIRALARERSAVIRFPDLEDEMRADLQRKADTVLDVINSYLKGGSNHDAFERICYLRHKRLAHRQTREPETATTDPTDGEVEAFYQDTLGLVQSLLSLVNGHAYDPQERADIHKRYASEFWAGVRGEQTEGHPNYRPRPTPSLHYTRGDEG